jgi:hypothetical protein
MVGPYSLHIRVVSIIYHIFNKREKPYTVVFLLTPPPPKKTLNGHKTKARKCSSSDMCRSANYISGSMTHLPKSLWGDAEGFRR